MQHNRIIMHGSFRLGDENVDYEPLIYIGSFKSFENLTAKIFNYAN